MSAPSERAPHIASGEPEAVFDEIHALLWALTCHAHCGQQHAALQDVEGLEHDLRRLRYCLGRAIFFFKGMRDGIE